MGTRLHPDEDVWGEGDDGGRRQERQHAQRQGRQGDADGEEGCVREDGSVGGDEQHREEGDSLNCNPGRRRHRRNAVPR